jgi:20S proteasome alpha/beta subunit
LSIVICVIDRAEKLYLAADKRESEGNSGKFNDNFQKIVKINEYLYLGMTGFVSEANRVSEALKQKNSSSTYTVKELVAYADSLIYPSEKMLTITLAGADDEGIPFVWQKNNDGNISIPEVRAELVTTAVATNENIDRANNYLTRRLTENRLDVEKSIDETIRYVADADKSVSPTYDIITRSF